jgi:hypothetical protein
MKSIKLCGDLTRSNVSYYKNFSIILLIWTSVLSKQYDISDVWSRFNNSIDMLKNNSR